MKGVPNEPISRVWLWIAGSGEGKGLFSGPAIAWQLREGPNGTPLRNSKLYGQDGGCTLHSALIQQIGRIVEQLPLNSQLHVFNNIGFIVNALGQGDLERWASGGFAKRPEHNKGEWAVIWDFIITKGIQVSAVKPERSAFDGKVLIELHRMAVGIRCWGPPMVPLGTRGKSVLDLMNERDMGEERRDE